MSLSSHPLEPRAGTQESEAAEVEIGRWASSLTAAIGVALAALAGWLGLGISQTYYATAPYHFDAAVYLLQSADLAQLLRDQGWLAALAESLTTKDSLDMTLRLLAPATLEQRYGHMAVLLPALALFAGLLCRYLVTRARSRLLAIAVSASLLTFPLLYDPFWGIAAYWKDNLATWLLASAVVAWLLARKLADMRWSIVSSALLGLLVAQRSAVSVYAALLFAPLFAWALYHQIRCAGVARALRLAAAFVLPAAVLGGLVLAWQWQRLYEYYFVYGYAYGSPGKVARYLAGGLGFGHIDRSVGFFVGMPYGIGYAPALTLGLAAPALVLAALRRRLADSWTAAWFLVGLPAIIIGTSTMFHGFFAIWTPLLVVMLAALYADLGTFSQRRWWAGAMLAVVVVAAAAQYQISSAQYQQFAADSARMRRYYATIGDLLRADSPSPRYAVVSGRALTGADMPLLRDQMIFDRGGYFPPPAFQAEIQDIAYQRFYPGQSEQQLLSQAIAALEAAEGTLAVSECDPAQIVLPRQVLARGVVGSLNSYVLNSPHWQALAQVALPARCVVISRYAARTLTLTEKWGAMVQYRVPVGLPAPTTKP